MDQPIVSVVLPCLDEAGSVAIVVKQAQEALAAAGLSGEVVVADNGSTDGSQEVARRAGARVVDAPIRGYGAALAAGFAAARGEVCVMADADATYPLERIGDLVQPILRGETDMTIGSRWSGTSMETMPFLHRFVGTPVITWLVRRAGGPRGLSDSQSGFRAFRRDRLAQLGLSTTGMEYASEMLIVAGRRGWRITEFETGYRERIGESKLDTFRDGWRHLETILLLAPNLAATLPGLIMSVFGAVLFIASLAMPGATQAGSPAWLAGFFGPAAIIVGVQAVLIGTLIAAVSPLATGPRSDPRTLMSSYAHASVWAIGAGLALCLGLVATWFAGLPAPVRAPQIESLALVLGITGAEALGTAVIGHLLYEHSRRFRGQVTALGKEPVTKTDAMAPSPVVANAAGRTA